MFSTSFTVTILTVSLHRVAHDLHSTPGSITWVVTAPALAQAVGLPVFGRLGDIKGHRNVYLLGFAVAIVFSVLTAFALNPLWLIGSRTIAQLAGSATVPASFAMLFRSFPPGQRVRASAWASGTLSAAAVSGLVIGGPIVDHFGWRPLFVIQAVLASAAFLPALVVLKPDSERIRVPVDVLGAVALAITVLCATLGINRLTAVGPTPLAVALLVILPFALFALVRIERRTTAPILPRDLLANPTIRKSSLVAALLGATWLGGFVITPLLLEGVFHYSATSTSLITACRTGSIVLGAPIASWLGTRWGVRRLLPIAMTGVVFGMVLLALGASIESLPLVVTALILSGLMFGQAQPTLIVVMANSVRESDFGAATSFQQTANQIGSVVGLGLVSAIAANATTGPPFATAYLFAAAMVAAGTVVCHFIRLQPRNPSLLGPGAARIAEGGDVAVNGGVLASVEPIEPDDAIPQGWRGRSEIR